MKMENKAGADLYSAGTPELESRRGFNCAKQCGCPPDPLLNYYIVVYDSSKVPSNIPEVTPNFDGITQHLH